MSIPRLKQSFKTEYKFFQDEKTVVCYVIPLNKLEFLDFYFRTNRVYTIDSIDTEFHTFKGVAVLKDGDTMNIEVGKQIARKKAMRAYFQYIKTEYGSLLRQVMNCVSERFEFIKQADRKINKLTEEIVEMTKED